MNFDCFFLFRWSGSLVTLLDKIFKIPVDTNSNFPFLNRAEGMKNYNHRQSMCYIWNFTVSDETTFIDLLLLNSLNKQQAYVDKIMWLSLTIITGIKYTSWQLTVRKSDNYVLFSNSAFD